MGCPVDYNVYPCEETGAPTILLLHGWGCEAGVFSFLIRQWVGRATLITLDFPGHGKSGDPPEPWGVPEYTSMVATLLEHLQLRQVHVLAHSFGGRVALLLASQHPERVRRMVLTGCAGLRKPVSRKAACKSARYKRYKSLLEGLRRVPLVGKMADSGLAALRRRYASPDYLALKTEVMRSTFVKVISQDLRPLLPSIQAPTLLIWGDQDTETPLWMGQAMEKEIPDAGLVVFDGCGHFAFVEEKLRFERIATHFLLEEAAG